MIRYVKHSEIDFLKWDACVKASPNGLMYAFSWYLNIVAGEWDAFVEGDYESVFPFFPKRKFGISYHIPPVWTQQLGLFSKNLLTPEKSLEFINQAVKKVKWFHMNLNSLQKLPKQYGIQVTENMNYVLELMSDYETIIKGYAENHRRNLKKEIEELSITTSVDHEEVIRLFRANKGTTVHVLNDEAYRKLNQLIYYARSIHVAEMYGVYDKTNTLLAGAVFFKVSNRSIMLFSAISEEGRKNSAMHHLMNEYIRENAGTNIILDFEGSNDANLGRFYKGFGAVNSPYLSVFQNRLPVPSGLIRFFRRK